MLPHSRMGPTNTHIRRLSNPFEIEFRFAFARFFHSLSTNDISVREN